MSCAIKKRNSEKRWLALSNTAYSFIFTQQSKTLLPILTEVLPTPRDTPIEDCEQIRILRPKILPGKSQLIFEQVPDKISLGQKLLVEPESSDLLKTLKYLMWSISSDTIPISPNRQQLSSLIRLVSTDQHATFSHLSSLTDISPWDKRIGLGSIFLKPSNLGTSTVLTWGTDGFQNFRERILGELLLFSELISHYKKRDTNLLQNIIHEIVSGFVLSEDAIRATWISHLLRTAAFNPSMLPNHQEAVNNAINTLNMLNLTRTK